MVQPPFLFLHVETQFMTIAYMTMVYTGDSYHAYCLVALLVPSHYRTILRPSYPHNEISYTGKMTSLYWIRDYLNWHGYQIQSMGKGGMYLPADPLTLNVVEVKAHFYLYVSKRQVVCKFDMVDVFSGFCLYSCLNTFPIFFILFYLSNDLTRFLLSTVYSHIYIWIYIFGFL